MASTPKDFGTLFAHLRTDRGQRYPAATRQCAPHKPFLLLSVLDLFARGSLTTNLILPDLELGELFAAYWARIMPADWEGSLTYPFFHLKTSGFWTLIALPGQPDALAAIAELRTIGQLRRLVQGRNWILTCLSS